ncbi:MAG: LuxR family transcriptional regulator [Raoultibacter sp.]
MNYLGKSRRSTTIKAIVGSAFIWSWVDGLFMGAFFQSTGTPDGMSSLTPILVFLFSAAGLIAALKRQDSIERLLESKKAMIVCAALGSTGSLLCTLAGFLHSWPLVIVGSMLCGPFLAVFELGWGATYSHEGGRSAAPLVAGAFAFALVIDLPLMPMISQASALLFSLLPLASGLFFVSLSPAQRRYASQQNNVLPQSKGTRSRLRKYLGISTLLLGAVSLVMIGFGYMQHIVSFAPGSSLDNPASILVIIVRGITALIMFIAILVKPNRIGLAYRLGLLIMIAGFMVMPFFSDDLFWISGAIVIAGYTTFDILIWVVFSQIAYGQSQAPLKTIAAVRLITSPCYIIGALIATSLTTGIAQLYPPLAAVTTFVGYSVVIATVLMLSSEDIWISFRDSTIHATISSNDKEMDQTSYAEMRLADAGLTPREKDIALLLARGRTQPWIAEFFTISENTVSTHVRHIYQKVDVHNRQELIDVVFPKL